MPAPSAGAAVAAFNGGLDFLPPQRAAYQARRDVMCISCSRWPALKCCNLRAHFCLCRCAGLLGKTRPDGAVLHDEQDVLNYLLESGVSGVAGAYGLSPYFRLSIATDIDSVEEAGKRIARACAALI